MRNAKRLMAGLMTAAMIFSGTGVSQFATIPVFAATQMAPIAESAVVATITDAEGEVYKYDSLQNAFDYAVGDDTIVLTKDLVGTASTVSADYTGGEDINLDLNNHKVELTDNGTVIESSGAGSVTITGTGHITAASTGDASAIAVDGGIVVNGKVDVYGAIGTNVKLKLGTFSATPALTNLPEGYGAFKNTDGTYSVGLVTPVWSWIAPSGTNPPTCTVDLAIKDYSKSITGGAVAATVADKDTVAPTATKKGYDYYKASYSFTNGDNFVNGTSFETEKADWYKLNEKDALGHSYSASNVKFEKSAGEIVTVNGNLKYTATLTDANGGDTLYVTGTIAKTVDTTTSFTDNNGNVYQTKTTKVEKGVTTAPNCYTEGKGVKYTFSILDKDDEALVTGVSLTDEATVDKAEHDFTLTKSNVSIVWVLNGVENPSDTALAGLTKDSVLNYRVYATCKWYDGNDCENTKLLEEGVATVTSTDPSINASTHEEVKGKLQFSASYGYDYTADNGTTAHKVITKETAEIETDAIKAVAYHAPYAAKVGSYDIAADTNATVVYASGVITFDANKDYEVIKTPTCATEGVEYGFSAAKNSYVYQEIEKTEHTYVKVSGAAGHEDATTTKDGYDVYQCTNKDASGNLLHEDTIRSYNGKTAPVVAGIVGSDGGADSIYPRKGYTYKVAVKSDGTDDVSKDKIGGKNALNIAYVRTDNASNVSSYFGPITYVEGTGEDTATTIYGSLTVTKPEDLRCTENVTYTVTNDTYGHYVYIDTDTKGTKHGAYTGNVVWAADGTASVNIKCNDCNAIVDTKGISVEAVETVKPTCTEDGYTTYKASYTGTLENVTLTNDTYKGSIVEAVGHDVDTSKILATANADGTYSAKIWCDTENAYVADAVKTVDAPEVQTDKTRKIKVTLNDDVIENTLSTSTYSLTLIDKGSVVFEEGEADTGKFVYGKVWNNEPQAVIKGVKLENGKANEAKFSVVVKNSNNEVINEETDEEKYEALPVGIYTAEITGENGYTGIITTTFEIIENVDTDYLWVVSLDQEEYYKGRSVPPVLEPETEYDGASHKLEIGAYEVDGYGIYKKVMAEDVTVSLSMDGKEVTPDDLVFTNAGKYTVIATVSQPNFTTKTETINVTISQKVVHVTIDNSSMVEGAEPDIKYTLKDSDGKTIDEKEIGFKIISTGGDDLTKLRPGTYTLSATATNENYTVSLDNWESPVLTVVANDGSTTEEQALADAAAKKINDLTDASTADEVAAARKAYDALSDKAKSRVDAATVKKLTDAEDKVAADKIVDQLNKATTDADKAAAYEAYSKLSDAQKKLVDAKAADAVAAAKTAKDAADKAAAEEAAKKEAAAKEAATKTAKTAKTAAAKVASTNPKYSTVQSAVKALDKVLADKNATSAQIKAATDKVNAAVKASKTAGVKKGATYTVGGQKYKATSTKAVTLTKAKNAKSVTVPATVKINGKKIAVTKIGAKAFAKSKATKVTIKTKKLTKKGVKNSLKGSKVKNVKVSCGKAYVKKYKKFFTKANAGKKVTVK